MRLYAETMSVIWTNQAKQYLIDQTQIDYFNVVFSLITLYELLKLKCFFSSKHKNWLISTLQGVKASVTQQSSFQVR